MQDGVCGIFSDHLVSPTISKTWLSSWHSESARFNMILVYSRTFLPFKWSLILSWGCTLLMSKSIGNALFKFLNYIVREEEKMRGRDKCLWKIKSCLCFLCTNQPCPHPSEWEWTIALCAAAGCEQPAHVQGCPKGELAGSAERAGSSSQAAQNALVAFWRWVWVWVC